MTAIGQLQAELQPHKRRHSKTKFTASYGRLGSNGLMTEIKIEKRYGEVGDTARLWFYAFRSL